MMSMFLVCLLGSLISVNCLNVATMDSNTDYQQQSDQAKQACILAGEWINELGSVMNITWCSDRDLYGTYQSAVGVAKYTYVLYGRYTTENQTNAVLGWTVSWKNAFLNAHSVTTWSGIYSASEGIIYTQWLLTAYQDRANLWSATRVGHDEFKRRNM